MSNTYPSQAAMRELANKFTHRLPKTYTVAESFATTAAIKGAPVITVKNGSGDTVALFTMQGLEIEGTQDVLGLPQRSYHPHVIKAIVAKAAPLAVSHGALLGEVYKTGTKIEFIATKMDNTDPDAPVEIAPVEADLAAAADAVWVNDVFWPVSNSL